MISSRAKAVAVLQQVCSWSTKAACRRCISRDVYESFVKPGVQRELKKMTLVDPQKIIPRPFKIKEVPEITLMTKEQLEQAQQLAQEKAYMVAQMPPVLPPHEEVENVLSDDSEALAMYSENHYVFVDTTVGLSERARRIVVRYADGKLAEAPREMRERALQVYFPKKDRHMRPPALLFNENIKRLLDNQRYNYILDVACNQYEPDHPHYIDVCHQVYDHIEENRSYDTLLSTRHYGPMVFTKVINKNITNFLTHLVKHNRLDECLSVIKVYNLVWSPQEQGDVPVQEDTTPSDIQKIQTVQEFIKNEEFQSTDLHSELEDLLAKSQHISKKAASNK